MKVFVTGGGGFLGKSLLKSLGDNGISYDAPSSRDVDLLERGSLNSFSSDSYDQIIHLAAWTQAGRFCLDYPSEQWIRNQLINTHIIEWWVAKQRRAKFIFMGTSCAYSPGLPHVEENYLAGEPTESLYTYAMTKRMLFQGAVAAQLQFGLKWLCLVPSTLYGCDYHTDGRQMHFIFDLIRKILRAKHTGEPAILWGDGNQRRELIHTADFIKGLHALNGIAENTIVNIGGGEDYSIRQFADMICEAADVQHDLVQYDPTQYVGAKEKRLVTDKLAGYLPDFYNHQLPIYDGIREVVDWFEKERLYLA